MYLCAPPPFPLPPGLYVSLLPKRNKEKILQHENLVSKPVLNIFVVDPSQSQFAF